jgi:cathepsin D
MAFPEVSTLGTPSFFDNLVAEGSVVVPQFSFKLAANDSELFLGGSNSDLFTGEFTTVNVTVLVRSCVQGAEMLLLMIYSGRVSGK